MDPRLQTLGGERVLVCSEDEQLTGDEDCAVDLIGVLFGTQARAIAIPVNVLPDEFFDLSSGLAGSFINKMVIYEILVVFIGDLSDRAPAGSPLEAFIVESNRGRVVRFVDTLEDAIPLR